MDPPVVRTGALALTLALLVPLVLAGCLGYEETTTAALAPAAEEATAPLRQVALHHEGRIPTMVIACPLVACIAAPSRDGWNATLALAEEGTLASLRVVLTWEASSPAMEELGLEVARGTGESYESLGFVYGPSPLVLELDEPIALDPAQEVRISAAIMSRVPAPVFVTTEQRVSIDGVAWVRA